ncbi:hypothetical protein GGQ58_003457 [Paracoccus denitrificans]|jgi:hypothetical protein|nr:hypothetical protein [Paracoccus denitrificans]
MLETRSSLSGPVLPLPIHVPGFSELLAPVA